MESKFIKYRFAHLFPLIFILSTFLFLITAPCIKTSTRPHPCGIDSTYYVFYEWMISGSYLSKGVVSFGCSVIHRDRISCSNLNDAAMGFALSLIILPLFGCILDWVLSYLNLQKSNRKLLT